MKNTSVIFILIFLLSCGKKTASQGFAEVEESAAAPYDTVAIDSFSQGATSVDIAAKIKMSSLKYQDSLSKVNLKNEEDRLLKKAQDEKLAAEKKAKAELDKAKEKAASTSPKTDLPINQ